MRDVPSSVTRKSVILAALLAGLAAASALPAAAQGFDRDALTLLQLRRGAHDVVAWTESLPAGSATTDAVPARDARVAAWDAWKRFLDYQIALQELGRAHHDWWRQEGSARSEKFALARAASLARYRAGLELIDRIERDETLRHVLDDAVPELGLPEGTYSGLKADLLNFVAAGKWAAWSMAAQAVPCETCASLDEAVAADSAAIERFARGRGEALTVRNAGHIVKSLGKDAWFPVQARTAEWMGDTKVRHRGESLIPPERARLLAPRLQPGDILLTRREWYVSNIGLPGYWSHAALYVGTPEERRAWAAGDASVSSFVRAEGRADGDFEALLQERVPGPHGASLAAAHGAPPRVLEAISEGVTFSTLEHAGDSDALAVLRPRVPRGDQARALLRAFEYAGRPYDYDFDFRTDSALVCTELVCKAYEHEGERRLIFPIASVMGRPVVPANDLARRFDETFGTPLQQFDLVLFLDGNERTGIARERAAADFRTTWTRPKWHVMTSAARHD